MLLIFVPITRVLTAKLCALVLPVRSLSVALIDGPHAFVLISVGVELNAEALLAVVAPIADILL